MIIKVLMENTTINKNLYSEHGLSLFIQTIKHKILFDMGQSKRFLDNAKIMGIDISDVDTAFVSHGHYDHGGGLKTFMSINDKAPVYINPKALKDYYALRPSGQIKYIGLDKFEEQLRFSYIKDYHRIDEEIEVFSAVIQKEYKPYYNNVLFMDNNGDKILDSFEHENNLIINTEGKHVLVAGCAHNGIINIINRYKEIKGGYPDYVIGGFHMFNPSSNESEKPEVIESIAKKVNNGQTKYFTGHCTGPFAYSILKEILQDNIENLSTGKTISI